MRRRMLLLAGGMLALGGCGAQEALTPPPGKSLPVAPYGARTAPASPDLLKPAPQTRPGRSGDLIESSNARRSDDFDLPPN